MGEVWTFLQLAFLFGDSWESLASHCDQTSAEVLELKAPPLGVGFPPRLPLGLEILGLKKEFRPGHCIALYSQCTATFAD